MTAPPKRPNSPAKPPAAELRLDSPIQFVRGVGPQRAAAFAELGIHTVADLLDYFPFRHELDQGEVPIADLVPGANAVIRGIVTRVAGRRPTVRCDLEDGTGRCTLTFFRQWYGTQGLFVGAGVIARGKVEVYDDRLQIKQPHIEVLAPEDIRDNVRRAPRQIGIYRASQRLNSTAIRKAVEQVLQIDPLPIPEVLPADVLTKHQLPTRAAAVRHLHVPPDEQTRIAARRRLAFEELFLMEVGLALRRRQRQTLQRGRVLITTPKIDERIRARFPFPLTAAQNRALRDIIHDLQAGVPMSRLVQGDVGSGKTVVALYAALVAVAHRKQAAIMAPTEILARQHFLSIERYLADSRVRAVLLRGGLRGSERTAIRAAIQAGEIDLVVGTQALIQKDVAFNDLALVVIDEQHKFGVLQRHTFRTKGPLPHYLVMTATPIPRTLAMTVFGDLDVSVIDELPPGRGQVSTRIVSGGQWTSVMEQVRGEIERGSQAYVVCPAIESADDDAPVAPQQRRPLNLVSVKRMHERLTAGPWRNLDVGLLHGDLSSDEKDAAIQAFAGGKLHALVATTVVEVGIDVPNASIMVIENADRFGLSQLHQLRGRIGRGSRDGLCILVARSRSPQAAERLAVMSETADGFRIAEADLRQRGPGEFFGTRQHGLPELRVANVIDDFALLELARQEAFDLVRDDPGLTQPAHAALRTAVRRAYAARLALIDAG